MRSVVCPPPIINHQSSITPCKTILGSKSAVKDFWYLPGDSPHAYRLKPLACFGEFDLDRVLGGLGGPARKKTLVLGVAASLRFHW
jgi:hypothetical protein